jgi:hypothetical protein
MPRGRLQRKLGRFTGTSHKQWQWRLFSGRGRLYRLNGNTMGVYARVKTSCVTRRSNRWLKTCQGIPRRARGEICLVLVVGTSKATILFSVKYFPPTQTSTYFWEALKKWDRAWLWNNLRWVGDDGWIAAAIANNPCIAVTDGLYMKEIYPGIQSAALVLECTGGSGWL